MFDAIADRYDLLNRIISLGIDQRWRRLTVQRLELGADPRVLDLATGTGDLALLIARTHPDAHVVGVDPSRNMLAIGASKVDEAGLAERVEMKEGDAHHLPFEDDTFDAATIAFGIRNVPDRALGLRELARVTKPGGRVGILELSEPRAGIMGAFARFHVHHVVPTIGALLSGKKEYRYLQKSIAAFPPPDEFAALMKENGFAEVDVVSLTFGTCALFVGRVPS
ncbi:MAG: bifunctional demethylmenaquinone methyltransferase/2-methoxy-6-polyprenyl-1,4-benzoquinol methylase UbiE [Sandaracinaceae bacterium]